MQVAVRLCALLLAACTLFGSAAAISPVDNKSADNNPTNNSSAARPNFIFMIADDMAAEDCGAMGHPHIRTPNLDRLAAEGLTFDRAFLTCSSCSPSRASMITCRYPHQTDAAQLHQPIPPGQITFVERLHDAGYYTAASGKWHMGNAIRHAFDKVNEVSAAGFQLQTGDQGQSRVMSDANNASGCAGWVQTLADCPTDQPFFLWLAAVDPHRDYLPGILKKPHTRDDVVVPSYLPDTPKVRDDLALYYDEITRLDSYVGAVLEQLEASGRADNTYVIFISDNGRPFPRCKTTVLDSGIHTPMFVRCPSKVPAGKRTEALVSTIDIGTTLLDLAGVEPADTMEGQSFATVLSDPAQPHREHIFAEHNWHDYDAYQRAIRTTKFKYILNFDQDLTLSPPADAVRSPTFREMRRLRDAGQLPAEQMQCFVSPRPREELYDLANDPDELHNLADNPEFQSVLAAHREKLQQWRARTYDSAYTLRAADEFDRETGDPLPNRKRPRPAKYDGFVPMFNGKDLAGWQRINTHPSTWRFEDGLLICSGKPIGELRTERMYQNFVLDLEWRHMVPGGNAGVFVWADDITAKGVPFHRGIEVQVLENDYGNTRSYTTHGDIFPIHGATMQPINGRGGQRAFPTEQRSNPSPEWNHYRIVCNNGEISLAVNGKFVTQGRACNPRKGYICLESEGGVVHYRNIRIKELPDTPITPAEIAIADRGYQCRYLGIDLDGWQTEQPNAWKASDWTLQCRPTEDQPTASLATEDIYGSLDFIIDIRPSEDTKAWEVGLAGATFGSDQPEIAKAMAQPGRWYRLEASVQNGRAALKIDGQTVIESQPAGRSLGPLRIQSTGPIDLANIYTR